METIYHSRIARKLAKSNEPLTSIIGQEFIVKEATSSGDKFTEHGHVVALSLVSV